MKENTSRNHWDAVRRLLGMVKEYLAVITVRELRGRALIVFYCWFASALVYYGISLNATNIRLKIITYIVSESLISILASLGLSKHVHLSAIQHFDN